MKKSRVCSSLKTALHEFRKIETGITGTTDIEIVKGLTDGEQIIIGSYKSDHRPSAITRRSRSTTRAPSAVVARS